MVKILIVEDEDELRNALRRTLEMNGYEVTLASDGRQGLEEIASNKPDIVLTDIFMPGMEGLETIRTLATKYPELPVVVMTGSLDPLFIELSLRFGALKGLNKPFSADELFMTIEKALAREANGIMAGEQGVSPEKSC
ncbi:MAG: response regulator [Rhodothermales bacterium]